MRTQSIFKSAFGLRSESGIALLIVMGAIIVLTMISVEFVYDAQIDYHLSLRQKERMQATYLAQSAYNLTLLEIKLGNAAQEQIAAFIAKSNMALTVDLSAPLCAQLPIKTGLFRAVLAMQGGGPEGGETPSAEDSGLLNAFPVSGIEDFLKFDGDFSTECADESAKINLNYFYDQDPSRETIKADNPYDDYKKMITKVLSQQVYADLFEEAEITPQELVRNIADWIDPNENINELGRQERGGEDSLYRGGRPGQMTTKNGKLSTPEEIYQVSGIQDRFWIPLSDLFTIYGTKSEEGKPQINVCRASDEVLKGLILHYAETRGDLPPMKPEEEAEILTELMAKVRESCTGAKPDKNEIAAALDGGLQEVLKVNALPGGEAAEAEEEAPPESAAPEGEEGTKPGGEKSSSAFADWITTESQFYSMLLEGSVGKSTVRIRAVIDLREPGGADAKKWNVVYWKIY